MALGSRQVGTGLGLKPINLSAPIAPDSAFDSTVRIPIKSTAYVRPRRAPIAPALTAAVAPPTAPLAQAVSPSVAPAGAPVTSASAPPPAAAPVPTPPPATPTPQPTYDPSQLNFEGSTFNPGVPATNPTATVDQNAASGLLTQLEEFTRLKIDPKWRSLPPDELLRNVGQLIEHTKQYGTNDPDFHADTTMRKRLDDWYAAFKSTVQRGTSPNVDYQTQYLGQNIYNNAVERLKAQGAADAQQQDEEVLSMLASRGLLNSGIAARELTRLNQTRMQNLYDAANRLNEMLLSNELGRITQRDLTTLQADLTKRNQEAYLRLQQRLQKESQPSPFAQIAGTAIGTALPFILSPRKPSAKGAGEGTPIYDDRLTTTRTA